jgi:hypothetical protein
MLSSKTPDEIVTVEFDFSAVAAVVTSPVLTVSVYSGVDTTPSDIVSGTPQIVGAKVLQNITGGVLRAVYALDMQVDAGVERFVLRALLPILRPAG